MFPSAVPFTMSLTGPAVPGDSGRRCMLPAVGGLGSFCLWWWQLRLGLLGPRMRLCRLMTGLRGRVLALPRSRRGRRLLGTVSRRGLLRGSSFGPQYIFLKSESFSNPEKQEHDQDWK